MKTHLKSIKQLQCRLYFRTFTDGNGYKICESADIAQSENVRKYNEIVHFASLQALEVVETPTSTRSKKCKAATLVSAFK
jgi:hypothetical protein